MNNRLHGTAGGQLEDLLDFLHVGLGHAIRLGAEVAGTHVDVGGLAEHVRLVEGIHDVGAHSHGAVLFPEHHVVGLDLLERVLGQLDGRRQGIGHDADAQGRKGEGLGYHAPQHTGHLAGAQETLDVRHGHQFDGMGV